MSAIRVERIGSEILRGLSEILSMGLRDFELPAMTSFTYVRVAKDLKNAAVGVSVLGTEAQKKACFEAVCNSKSYFKHELARRLRHMRFLPELHFERDESLEYGAHISRMLSDLKGPDTDNKE